MASTITGISWTNAGGSLFASTTARADATVVAYPKVTFTGTPSTDITVFISDASGNVVSNGTSGSLTIGGSSYFTRDVSNNTAVTFDAGSNQTRTIYMTARSKANSAFKATFAYNTLAYPDTMTDIASTTAANTIYDYGSFGITDPSGNALSGKITFPASGSSFTIFTDVTPVNNGVNWYLIDTSSNLITNADNKIVRSNSTKVGSRSSLTLSVAADLSGVFYLTAYPIGGTGLRKTLAIVPAAGVTSVGPITNTNGYTQFYDVTDASNVLGLKVGNYAQLLAPVIPTTATQTVDWTSSDSSKVTVDASGQIYAVSA